MPGNIERPPQPGLLGAKPLPKENLQPNRDWTPYLPVFERQDNGTVFDPFNCTTVSALNCCEIMAKRRYGEEWNRSDRFTAVMSETVPGKGNYMDKVALSIQNEGTVSEDRYPFGFPSGNLWYMPVPKDIQIEAVQWLSAYDPLWEWADWGGCNPEKLWEALPHAPLQASVSYWAMVTNSYVPNTDHAIAIVGGEYKKKWVILDSYQEIHEVGWSFYFGSAMQHDILKKDYMNENIKVIKDKNSPSVGFWLPATSPAAIESMAYMLGKAVPKKGQEIDWENFVEGELTLK